MATPEDDKKLDAAAAADQDVDKQLETLISASESGDPSFFSSYLIFLVLIFSVSLPRSFNRLNK